MKLTIQSALPSKPPVDANVEPREYPPGTVWQSCGVIADDVGAEIGAITITTEIPYEIGAEYDLTISQS